MYKYIYVKSKARGLISREDHREIIDKYSEDGWSFVTVIPLPSGNHVISEFDLVFEIRKVNE